VISIDQCMAVSISAFIFGETSHICPLRMEYDEVQKLNNESSVKNFFD
jgi:hypothetical protein